jgi:tRNA(Met) C34 N-acetyltransferase TmcA
MPGPSLGGIERSSACEARPLSSASPRQVLGNTFGMLVLQDFEAMTPNLLARTIETVEGGGIIVFLLSSLDSLSKLYTLAMDCHAQARGARRGYSCWRKLTVVRCASIR